MRDLQHTRLQILSFSYMCQNCPLTHLVIAATPLFVGAAVRAEGYSGNIWSMNCWGV